MAQCQKQITVYSATGTASNSTHVATIVWAPDTTTALASCQYLSITATEYQALSHGYITDKATAETIAAPLILLIATAGIYKALKTAFDMSVESSDEKH